MADVSMEKNELFHLLKLMSELGITLKVDPSKNGCLISSFDKNLLPFLTELQPKVDKPPFDPNANYYLEFWKVFISNEILIASLKEISFEKVLMEQKIRDYERIYLELETQIKPRKKKRRTAKEIQKNYMCPYSHCKKRYGSNVSLNLHIKRSHNGGNKSEREKYAKEVFEAFKANKHAPPTQMTLYEGFIEGIQAEWSRLKALSYQEEFVPANLMKYSVDPLNGFMHSVSDDGSSSDEESFSSSCSSGEAESSEESEEENEKSPSEEARQGREDQVRISNKIKDTMDESLSGYTISVPLSSQKRVTEEKSPDNMTEEDNISETHSELLKKRRHSHHHHHHPVLNPKKIMPPNKKAIIPRKIGHQKPH